MWRWRTLPFFSGPSTKIVVIMRFPQLPDAVVNSSSTSTHDTMRIILTTFGSLGDLHPYLAIAHALKDRGHQPVIATSLFYKDKVEKAGIDFHPVRPSTILAP